MSEEKPAAIRAGLRDERPREPGRAPERAGPDDVQAVLAVVMVGSMFVFAVSWAVWWVMGLKSELMILVNMGVMGLSWGLYFLGGALLNWERGLWRPRGGWQAPWKPRAAVEIGRLVFLGTGIWFTAGGVTFFAVAFRLAFFGEEGLPPYAIRALVGTLAVRGVIFRVGLRYDQRRYEAAQEIEEAQQRADTHF